MNLKGILKSLKLNESTISMVLGALVIVIVGVLVVNYFKDRGKSTLPFLSTEEREITQTGTLPKSHTVAKGENLWTIALSIYGSGYNWVDLASANNLTNPGLITEGQVLVVPEVAVRKPVLAAEKTVSEPISGGTYTVVKGDNLWNIAIRAYGDGFKWVEIARENKLVNPDIIHSGNTLTLPR